MIAKRLLPVFFIVMTIVGLHACKVDTVIYPTIPKQNAIVKPVKDTTVMAPADTTKPVTPTTPTTPVAPIPPALPPSPYLLPVDTKEYFVKSGSITVTTPDTTLIFIAPHDSIVFTEGNYYGKPFFHITVIQPDFKSAFTITSAIARASGSVSTVGDFYLDEKRFDALIHHYYTFYDYLKLYGGPFNLDVYETGETLIKGTFACNAPRDGFDSVYLKCAGTFNLKLNLK